MEIEIFETMVFNSTLTWLIAWEDFSTFICRESFRSHIMNLNSEEIHHNVQCLENWRKKEASLLSSLVFMLGCRDKQVIPTCMNVKHHMDTPAARSILHCTNLALIWEWIHYTEWELDVNAWALLEKHLKLAAELTQNDCYVVDHATTVQNQVTIMKSAQNKRRTLNAGQGCIHEKEN
jgi:hypothetical protein